MTTKTIPLKAVLDALMFAKVRRCTGVIDGKRIGRGAAFTQNPHLNISCREARWGHRPHPLLVSHFSPMHQGDMERVLTRVRMHGLAEVRKTFGAGMRALKAEFADGIMR